MKSKYGVTKSELGNEEKLILFFGSTPMKKIGEDASEREGTTYEGIS